MNVQQNEIDEKYELEERIALETLYFFNPIRRFENGFDSEGNNLPFSGYDFYKYFSNKYSKYQGSLFKIERILNLLENKNFLTSYENKTNDPFLNKRYFFLKSFTKCQCNNSLYLGKILGIGYIHYKLKRNVIHITGINSENKIGNGTGFLIKDNIILTNKHITDMKIELNGEKNVISIYGEKYKFNDADIRLHPEKDIALIYLKTPVKRDFIYPAFRKCQETEDILIMGFPPMPCTTSAQLHSSFGKISSIVETYSPLMKNIVITAEIYPGNSGSPVLTSDGNIIGLVYGSAGNEPTTQCQNIIPKNSFNLAIEGKDLYDSIKEMDETIEIFFDDEYYTADLM